MRHITIAESDVIFSEIKNAASILLHCHPNPDGDSLGSTLAMMHALRGMGKNATVIKGDSNPPGHLSMLPGFADIAPTNYFETDLSKFDLFLILDSSSPNQISKIREVVFPETLKTVVIDHHASNAGFAGINLVEPAYPAASQIVYELLKAWKLPITREIAECLFVGIYTDTGGFKYPGTTSKTLHIAAELVELAPNFTDLLAVLENSNTPGRIRIDAMMLDSIETYHNDSVAIASASYDAMMQKGVTEDDTRGNGVANMLVTVIGWEIGVSLIEQKPGIVKASFRTRDQERFDVSKIAAALGGGGHKGAAGAEFKGTIEEVKKLIVEKLGSTYDLSNIK